MSSTSVTADQKRPQAFILTGAFRVLCRNHRYLTELAARGLAILVLTPESSREQATSVLEKYEDFRSAISDVAYVDGTMEFESTFTAGAFAAIARWRRQYRIVGAFAMEEMLVEPTGLLCDALGLRSAGLRASRVCRSKYLQRAYLDEVSPASLTIPAEDRDAFDPHVLAFPVVLKPAARHASSGVVSCDSGQELGAAMAGYPDHETLLVEQKVVGQEFSVEALVQDGRVVFASVTEKRTTGSHSRAFVELAHTVPAGDSLSDRSPVAGTLIAANRRVLDLLDYRNGITHSEWRIAQDGKPYLIEIASRTPGDGITLLYALACAEALEPQIVRGALGEPVSYPAPQRFARQVYLEHTPGVLRDVAVDWVGLEPQWIGANDLWPALQPGSPGDAAALRGVLVLRERGALVRPLRSSDDRVVTFFIDADTIWELDDLEERVRAAITITIDGADVLRHAEAVPC